MRRKRPSFVLDELSEQGDVDLTPLIDVVFVVLIMFILVAPMLDLDKVHLASGSNNQITLSEESKSLLIHVHEDNTIFINKKAVEAEQLAPILKLLHQKNPKFIPQLYQDKKAYFGTYQTIKNAAEEAGFEELDVVLEPKR